MQWICIEQIIKSGIKLLCKKSIYNRWWWELLPNLNLDLEELIDSEDLLNVSREILQETESGKYQTK